MAKVCERVKAIIAKAYEVGAPVGGYFTVGWDSEQANGYIEVMEDKVVTDTRYSKDHSIPYYEKVDIPKDAVVVWVVEGYEGPVIYEADVT